MDPRRFVKEHGSPYDPAADHYDVPAFRRSITTTKATAVYAMHSYHQGKKPHDAIREYVRHYTRPGELVLDPFCGSGGTALACLLEGRKAVALDRSPAAAFIAGNYCSPADPDALEHAFDDLIEDVGPDLDWLYETRCDRCGGKARTTFTVFSERFECPRCRSKVALFDCMAATGRTRKGAPKKISVCPHCHRDGRVVEISTRSPRLGAVPVLSSYRCLEGCDPPVAERRHDDADSRKREFFRNYDLDKIRQIERREIPFWRPDNRFPSEFARWKTDLRPAGIETVADLYTKRSFWALAALRARALQSGCAQQALFALTAICLAASKMQRYSPASGFPNMLLVGTYYVPPIRREVEVGTWYRGKLRALLRGYRAIRAAAPGPTPWLVATADARKLAIPSDSIDYIFTDPPYADTVQYGELNFVWESWLRADLDWHSDEIVVNASRGKSDEDWAKALRRAMAECYRVLKPGRWLSLCYHDVSERRWAMVQDLMAEAGFEMDGSASAASIDTGQKSFNQFMTDKATKRDLVISFRKPKSGPRRPAAATDPAAFEPLARRIIAEFLATHPGATKDRVYDDLVARMLGLGRMQDHDFDAVLRSVAREVGPRAGQRRTKRTKDRGGSPEAGRWYLVETAGQ